MAARSVPTGPEVLGDLSRLPAPQARAFDITEQFPAMRVPGPDDWLSIHPEPPQSVDAYLQSAPNIVAPPRDIIVIAVLSELDPTEGPSVDELVQYTERFFGMKVRLLAGVNADVLGARRRTHMGARQLHATDVLDALEPRVPADAYCLIALTTEDLYPNDEFNFVFGIARLTARVGLFSFARYAAPIRAQAVRRAYKVLSHEVGHMFGITHCTHFACVMNGANHLEELDAAPAHLCPACLRKLHLNVGFEPQERYRALQRSYLAAGLASEADWVRRRVGYIGGGTP